MKKERIAVGRGFAKIYPDRPVVAGCLGQWDIVYTAGPGGLSQGATVRFEIPYGFSTPQTLHVTCPGFVAVDASAVADMSLHLGDPLLDHGRNVADFGCLVYIQINKGQIQQGQTITLHYGWSGKAAIHGGAEVRYFDGPAEFPVSIDADGTRSAPEGGFELLSAPPTLDVLPGQPVRLKVVVPSLYDVKETLKTSITAHDMYGNVVADSTASQPTTTSRTEMSVEAGPTIRIAIKENAGRLCGLSNPSTVRREGEPNLYWGDLHVMTAVSAGLRRPGQALRYARDCSRLDFCSVNDGDDAGGYFTDEEWEETRRAVRELYAPGHFVTFLGSEYHERRVAGDKNIIYLDDEEPLLRWSDLEGAQPEVLWQALDGRKALTIPHHTTSGSGSFRPFDFNNTEFQRLVEMYSVWGNSECDGCDRQNFWPHLLNWNNSVQAALNRGLRLGIVASSDSHDGRPGNSDWLRVRRGYFNGYTAVWAAELARESVFDALYNRRCYGTTGSRIILRFSVNGKPMGSELTDRGPRELYIQVSGTDTIDTITVIRNGLNVHTHVAGLDEVTLNWHDPDPFDAIARKGDDGLPFVYYYVRIRQVDGELAWSSPVWIS